MGQGMECQVAEVRRIQVGEAEEALGGVEQAVEVRAVVVEEDRTVEEIREAHKHWQQAQRRRQHNSGYR
jgi:hypothetical protein